MPEPEPASPPREAPAPKKETKRPYKRKHETKKLAEIQNKSVSVVKLSLPTKLVEIVRLSIYFVWVQTSYCIMAVYLHSYKIQIYECKKIISISETIGL